MGAERIVSNATVNGRNQVAGVRGWMGWVGWAGGLLVLSICGTVAAAGLTQEGLPQESLRIATFDVDATPEVGMMMAYDPVIRVEELGLRCRGIVLTGAGDPLVLCAVDWIGIGNEGHDLFREVLAEAAGTTPDRVAVHTLHQHDAPRFDASAERLLIEAGVSDLGFYQSALARDVLRRLAAAVRIGLQNSVPATHFGYGVAVVREVASNRRIMGPDGKVRATRYTATRDPQLRAEPEGVIDPELTAVTFYNGSKPVAVLTYYACHPQSYYRTGVPSPDFPGLARLIHAQEVPTALHVHFNGAGGNLGAGKYNDGSPANRMVLAQRLAEGMRSAFAGSRLTELTPADVGWRVEPVHLPVAGHLEPLALRQNLPKWKPSDFFGSPDRLAFWIRAQAGQPIELSCLRIGPVRVLHMPGELFVEYQLAAKAMRPDLVVAMAAYGDYAPGYIGTAVAYEQGGYETQPKSSNVGPAAEAVLMDGMRRLLADDDLPADYRAQLPRFAPKSPAEAVQSFEVADGFSLQLTAAEPLVSSPVAMQWDENGDLFVCEMRGYSEHRDDRLSRITRLRDLDQDGVYDESLVVVDQLLWPTALFPYDGGLFVVDAPDVLFFRDTDGDGRADQREVVLTELSVANVQGLANSFRWGLDNRLHLAGSSNGGLVYRPADGPASAVELRGRDLALDPRTGVWSLTGGAAQHGMAFDNWGRKFVCSNSDHIQQVLFDDRYVARNPKMIPAPARVSIAADGPQAEVFRVSPVEPWRVLRTRLRVRGQVAGPIEGGGRAAGYFTGATGVNIYRGDAYPADWQDLTGERAVAVVGDVGGNLIHRKQLDLDGQRFVATRVDEQREWVAARDTWFRPAQFENGPDGTLHVIDVYREVIEHPLSLPLEIKQHLDLNSGRDHERLYRIVPAGFRHRATPRLAAAPADELISLLEHPNAWHRETAARLLYQRPDPSIAPELARRATAAESPLGRLHALWGLAGMNHLDPSTLLRALQDPHPQVRRQALRLAERPWLLQDGEDGQGWDAKRLTVMTKMVQDPSREVRCQVAFSVGSLPPDQSEAGIDILCQLALLHPHDPLLQTAIQSSLAGRADRFLRRWLAENAAADGDPAWIAKLVTQMIAECEPTQLADVLQALIGTSEEVGPDLLAVVKPILVALRRSDAAADTGSSAMIAAAEAQSRHLELTAMEVAEQAVQSYLQSDDPRRVFPERVIERLAHVDPEVAIPKLLSWLEPRWPVDVQLLSIRTLTRFRGPQIAARYLEQWSAFSPRVRPVVMEALFADTAYVEATLVAALKDEIALNDLPLYRLQDLARRGAPRLRKMAEELIARGASSNRQSVVEQYRQRLNWPGDVGRGRQLFRQHCAGCHQLDGVGVPLGPSLRGLAPKGAEFILTNVLDPNLEVNPQFFNYLVLLQDGRTASGMIVEESAASLTVQRADHVRESLLRSEIEELRSTGQSLMPEGFERTLSPQDMTDLLRYLLDVE